LNAGIVQVYDGDGKGKTTAAFGLALRAAGQRLRVYIIQFLKCSNRYGELKAAARFAPLIEVVRTGAPCRSDDGSPDFECTGCMKCHVDPAHPRPDDIECARAGLELARTRCTDSSCDVLVLDELNCALSMGLLPVRDVLDMLSSRDPRVEVVITGRGAPKELVDSADLVTTMVEVKHHYARGILEVKGIDF
jgi:cob(I)alamin adenosyltransferase